MKLSPLQEARYEYNPKLPGMLRNGISEICVKTGEKTKSVADQEKIAALFPNTYGECEITFEKGKNTSDNKKQVVGVILSGGQAPGGHNVICGLYDALKATNKDNVLLGFKGGPSGLIEDDYIEMTDQYIDSYRNTGGFDIIGSGRTKLETEEQFEIVTEVAKKHGLTAIVIIGGDDSNTNAAVLAEYMAANNTGIQVIGCPKTIDGDLKNEDIEASFGFDTATKTYSELIGNIERDANSAKKYWHFIKVMGRSASHVALECALETQPNICLIGEEVAAKKMSLADITNQIADSVEKRAANGDNFGVAIIPEGIVEFVPEFSALIAEINELLAGEKTAQFNALPDWNAKYEFIKAGLSADAFKVFDILPQASSSSSSSRETLTATFRYPSSSPRSSSPRWLRTSSQRERKLAHTRASSALSTTSSVMKAVAHSLPTSMQTTATLWASTLSCSSSMVTQDTSQRFPTSPSLLTSGLQAVCLSQR